MLRLMRNPIDLIIEKALFPKQPLCLHQNFRPEEQRGLATGQRRDVWSVYGSPAGTGDGDEKRMCVHVCVHARVYASMCAQHRGAGGRKDHCSHLGWSGLRLSPLFWLYNELAEASTKPDTQ